jgi:precorrin-6B methylase 2
LDDLSVSSLAKGAGNSSRVYPQEIIAMLQREAGLTPATIIADVGSGTGISADLFLRFGCTVHAVEPNREMREAAERLLSHHGGFHGVNGSAQATTLPIGSTHPRPVPSSAAY